MKGEDKVLRQKAPTCLKAQICEILLLILLVIIGLESVLNYLDQ